MRVLLDVKPTPEQLTVITDPRPGAVVVRGAAGSGKTTTALLRLRQTTAYWRRLIAAVADENGVDITKPWSKLKKSEREIFLNGTGGERHQVTYTNRFGRRRSYKVRFEGIVNQLQRRYEETDSETNRERIESYMAEQPCPDCGGARLRPESLAVKIGGLSIAEYSALSASAAGKWIRGLELT